MFFSKRSAHIEIVRDHSIEKVQFIVLPYMSELPKETKVEFNNKVNRSSPKTKVGDLVQHADHIIEVCKHELRLKLFFSRNKLIAIFANFVNLWKDLAFILVHKVFLLLISRTSARISSSFLLIQPIPALLLIQTVMTAD